MACCKKGSEGCGFHYSFCKLGLHCPVSSPCLTPVPHRPVPLMPSLPQQVSLLPCPPPLAGRFPVVHPPTLESLWHLPLSAFQLLNCVDPLPTVLSFPVFLFLGGLFLLCLDVDSGWHTRQMSTVLNQSLQRTLITWVGLTLQSQVKSTEYRVVDTRGSKEKRRGKWVNLEIVVLVSS